MAAMFLFVLIFFSNMLSRARPIPPTSPDRHTACTLCSVATPPAENHPGLSYDPSLSAKDLTETVLANTNLYDPRNAGSSGNGGTSTDTGLIIAILHVAGIVLTLVVWILFKLYTKSERYRQRRSKMGDVLAQPTLERYKEMTERRRPGSNTSEESLAEHLLEQAHSEVAEAGSDGQDDSHDSDLLSVPCSTKTESTVSATSARWRGWHGSSSSSSIDPVSYQPTGLGTSRSGLGGSTLGDSGVSSSFSLAVGSGAPNDAYMAGSSSAGSRSNRTTSCTPIGTERGDLSGRNSDNAGIHQGLDEAHIAPDISRPSPSRNTGSQVDESPALTQGTLHARPVGTNAPSRSPPELSPETRRPVENSPFVSNRALNMRLLQGLRTIREPSVD
jgi:hypothetical protein